MDQPKRRSGYMPLISHRPPSPPPPLPAPLVPPHASSSSSSASSSPSSTTSRPEPLTASTRIPTDRLTPSSSADASPRSIDPIYQNVEECRFLYDTPHNDSGYRTMEKEFNRFSDTPPPGYRRIDHPRGSVGAVKMHFINNLPPPPPLEEPSTSTKAHGHPEKSSAMHLHHHGGSTTSVPHTVRSLSSARKSATSPTNIIPYYEDVSEYGDTGFRLMLNSSARPIDTRPLSLPPCELRRMGSQKSGSLTKGHSSKSGSFCSCGLLCCLSLSTLFVFALAYAIYYFFGDIEKWTRETVINRL